MDLNGDVAVKRRFGRIRGHVGSCAGDRVVDGGG